MIRAIEEINLRIQVCNDVNEQLTSKFKQLNVRLDELDNAQKVINVKSDKMAQKMGKQENHIKEKSESLRNDLLELISKSQRQLENSRTTF